VSSAVEGGGTKEEARGQQRSCAADAAHREQCIDHHPACSLPSSNQKEGRAQRGGVLPVRGHSLLVPPHRRVALKTITLVRVPMSPKDS
jgi:hypothetical protein